MVLSFEQKEEIGLKYVQDRLEPAGPYGVKYLKHEGFYGPERQKELEEELENVALLIRMLKEQSQQLLDVQHAISGLKDLSGTFRNLREQPLSEVELFELLAFCRRLEALLPMTEALEGYPLLRGTALQSPKAVLEILDPEGDSPAGFYVEDHRSPALLRAREAKREAERALRAAEGEKEKLLQRRQEAALAEEEALNRIYREVTEALRPHGDLLEANAAAIGRLDAGIAKAVLARRWNCVRPRMGAPSLTLRDAFHPEVAEALEGRGRSFTPLSLGLPKGVSVLTGANMGGKSIALKTVLLNTALVLSGCFVFAQRAEIPLFSRIEIINRDFSNASQGLSSFGGEILRLKETLERLKEGGLSLIVMDELARGTNAREGAVIVRGTVRYLSDKNAVTLLATHYDGAAGEGVRHYQVKGLGGASLSPEAGEGPLGEAADGLRKIENAMDYGLIEVEAGTRCPQDALTICRLLGLPSDITEGWIEDEKRES
ncbi:MAG: hypothetical protein J6H18_04635 [Lachnospiraceae bacterium]|nr:hypothetical protein [Lachnospiraceae bacterium]